MKNNPDSGVVGFLTGVVAFDAFLVNLLPEGAEGITVVLENTCGQAFTYKLTGRSAFYQGEGDFHDKSFDGMKKTVPFHGFEDPESAASFQGVCLYSFSVYPEQELEDSYLSEVSLALVIIVGAVSSEICDRLSTSLLAG